MVSALVLLKVKRDRINEVAATLAGMDGISEVFSVTGQYDLVAILRVASNDDIADLVTGHMLKVEGITESDTMMAFKVFSQHDLAAMFEIGLD